MTGIRIPSLAPFFSDRGFSIVVVRFFCCKPHTIYGLSRGESSGASFVSKAFNSRAFGPVKGSPDLQFFGYLVVLSPPSILAAGRQTMPMARLDGYDFVFRERALTAFLVFVDDRLVSGNIPQLPDFRDGDCWFIPGIFVAFNVHEELLARVILGLRHGGAAAHCMQ